MKTKTQRNTGGHPDEADAFDDDLQEKEVRVRIPEASAKRTVGIPHISNETKNEILTVVAPDQHYEPRLNILTTFQPVGKQAMALLQQFCTPGTSPQQLFKDEEFYHAFNCLAIRLHGMHWKHETPDARVLRYDLKGLLRPLARMHVLSQEPNVVEAEFLPAFCKTFVQDAAVRDALLAPPPPAFPELPKRWQEAVANSSPVAHVAETVLEKYATPGVTMNALCNRKSYEASRFLDVLQIYVADRNIGEKGMLAARRNQYYNYQLWNCLKELGVLDARWSGGEDKSVDFSALISDTLGKQA